jgi:hypothetical protein
MAASRPHSDSTAKISAQMFQSIQIRSSIQLPMIFATLTANEMARSSANVMKHQLASIILWVWKV